jgi:hypothetical protein
LHNPGHETAAPAVAVDARLATGDLTGMAPPAAFFQPESSSIGEILRDDYDPHPGRRLHSLLCVWLN